MLDAFAYYTPRLTLLATIGWVLAQVTIPAMERLTPLLAN